MENRESLSRTTNPFEKYIFHFLPGLPVLVGVCIIFWKLDVLGNIINKINETQLSSNEGLLWFVLFLIILFIALSFIFLFGMIVDSIRHCLEECLFKWSGYKGGEYKEGEYLKILAAKWDLYEKIHEREYFYTEFFGDVAIALAFLWGVIIWVYDKNLLNIYFILTILFFIFRPFWECISKLQDFKKENKILDVLKKFICSFLSILILVFSAVLVFLGAMLKQNFYFIFFILISIIPSFEFYILRVKRYRELLEMFMLVSQKG